MSEDISKSSAPAESEEQPKEPENTARLSDSESEEYAAFGSPWSSAEGGWDGESMPTAETADDGAADDGAAGNGPPPPPLPPANDLPATPAEGSGPAPATSTKESKDKDKKPEAEHKPMTLMDHLGELRTRLVRACIAVGLAFCACYSFADILFRELCRPLVQALPPGSKLIFTALPEAFFVYLQVGFVAAVFVASPYIFYQIWAFVAPGLYDEEKELMIPMAACSAMFFLAGAAFCFFVVFPFAFTFFVGFATEDIAAMPSLKEYLGFALKLLIAFGLIFEMPLFTFFLARMGLVTAALMRKVRRYAILVIFIVAAILTPPDVVSQLLMAMPMLLLYELSILVAVTFGRKKKTEDNEEGDQNNTNEAKA